MTAKCYICNKALIESERFDLDETTYWACEKHKNKDIGQYNISFCNVKIRQSSFRDFTFSFDVQLGEKKRKELEKLHFEDRLKYILKELKE